MPTGGQLRSAYRAMLFGVFGAAGCATRHQPAAIPLAQPPAWATVFRAFGFQISAITQHVERVGDDAVLIWFLTLHDQVRHADSLSFDRSRIRLLARCRPLAFRSVSQELALDGATPVSRIEWPSSGPKALPWRVPEPGATDDAFLRRTCAMLGMPLR